MFYNISESWEKDFYKYIHAYLFSFIKMRKCLYSSLYSTTETGKALFLKHIHVYLRHIMGLVSEHCNMVSMALNLI